MSMTKEERKVYMRNYRAVNDVREGARREASRPNRKAKMQELIDAAVKAEILRERKLIDGEIA